MTTPHDQIRSTEVEVEVPGTPEQVWEAIATGPGITAWFVPCDVEGRAGGTVTHNHGPGMETSGTISAWDPPRRFAFEEDWQPSESATTEHIATEFLVEARAGGTCVVRVVTSGFGTGADWDQAAEGVGAGWRSALDSLRLYLTHFAGRRCSSIVVGRQLTWPHDRAWAVLSSALGVAGAAAGDRVTASVPGGPALSGLVERADEQVLSLVVDEPAPGLAYLGAGGPSDEAYVFLRAHLFGDDAPAAVARDEPAWRAWIEERLPG